MCHQDRTQKGHRKMSSSEAWEEAGKGGQHAEIGVLGGERLREDGFQWDKI